MAGNETRSARNQSKKQFSWVVVTILAMVIIGIGITIGVVLGSQNSGHETKHDMTMSSKTSDVSDDSSGIDSESNTVDENTSSTVVSESSQTVDPSENDGTASEGDDEMISTLPSDVSPDGAGNYVSADGMTAYIPQGNGKYITLPTSSTPYTGRGYLKQLQLAEYKRENLEKGINQLSDTQKQNLEKIGKN